MKPAIWYAVRTDLIRQVVDAMAPFASYDEARDADYIVDRPVFDVSSVVLKLVDDAERRGWEMAREGIAENFDSEDAKFIRSLEFPEKQKPVGKGDDS